MVLRRSRLPALLAFAACSIAGRAWAHGGGEGVSPDTSRPPAPAGQGATAEQIVKALEARKRDPALAKVVAEPLRQAKSALERAHGARVAGDAPHARNLDAVALEWAETARDLERAAAAEASAGTGAGKAREVAIRVERARALLEETQARRGRAAAELERAEAEARGAGAAAAATEQGRIDASKKKAPAKAPAPPAAAAPPKEGDKPKPAPGSDPKPKGEGKGDGGGKGDGTGKGVKPKKADK